MGSIGAMQQGSADRYFQESSTGNPNADKLVPEGIEGRVPYKGSMVTIVFQMAGGVRASMGYCGCATIAEMQDKAEFVEITSAGIRESHVHDVQSPRKRPTTGGLITPRLRALRCSHPCWVTPADWQAPAAFLGCDTRKRFSSCNTRKSSSSIWFPGYPAHRPPCARSPCVLRSASRDDGRLGA